MESTNRTVLFLLLGYLLLSRCEASKKVDCRKYVFAPICRGASKRDLQKLEPLFEEPRKPRYMNNGQNSESYRSSQENMVYDKILLDALMRKINPKNDVEYDTGTDC